MKFLYINITREAPARDRVFLGGLRKNGEEIVELYDNSPSWRKFWNLFKKLRAIGGNYDLMWVGFSAHILVPFARLVSRKKIIFNAAHSLYEGIIISRGQGSPLSPRSIYCWLVDFLAFHCASLVLVESNAQKRWLARKFLVSENKFARVWTGADDKVFFYDPDIVKLPVFTVLFRGGFLPESGIEYAIRAAKLLRNEDINFRIIGSGLMEGKAKELLASFDSSRVEWIRDRLAPDILRQKMQECHLSLGQLSDHERLERTIPHKAFESTAMRIPYLTARNRGVLELLTENKTCFCCNPADANDIADKILLIKNSSDKGMKIAKNAQRLCQREFLPEILADDLLVKFFRPLANPYLKKLGTFRNLRNMLVFRCILKPIFFLFGLLPPKPNTLAIIKMDGIGDYVLFRNFLGIIRKSKRFAGHKITLCGNNIWQDLAESFDGKTIDNFFWVNKNRFISDLFYKISILGKLAVKRFEIALHPTYSRDMPADVIAKAAGTTKLIGDSGGFQNIRPEQKEITDSFYDELIDTGARVQFEMSRYKTFIEKITGEKIGEIQSSLGRLHRAGDRAASSKFAVIFPGASHKSRIWATDNFIRIANYVSAKYGFRIVIASGVKEKEKETASRLVAGVNAAAGAADWSGRPLSELAKLLAESELLVANDTGVMHLGIAAGTRVVCVSNGRHFGRYTPYPENIYPNMISIYPPKIQELGGGQVERQKEELHYGSSLNINDIRPEEVEKQIDILMSRSAR